MQGKNNQNLNLALVILQYTNTCKYLGLDQHLSFNDCVRTLADSGSRALGSVISKLKSLKM